MFLFKIQMWRRHGGVLVVWVGIGEEAVGLDQNRPTSQNVHFSFAELRQICLGCYYA
jgi:hypothetical protein